MKSDASRRYISTSKIWNLFKRQEKSLGLKSVLIRFNLLPSRLPVCKDASRVGLGIFISINSISSRIPQRSGALAEEGSLRPSKGLVVPWANGIPAGRGSEFSSFKLKLSPARRPSSRLLCRRLRFRASDCVHARPPLLLARFGAVICPLRPRGAAGRCGVRRRGGSLIALRSTICIVAGGPRVLVTFHSLPPRGREIILALEPPAAP